MNDKPKTKGQRLIELFNAYQDLVGGRPCTIAEVAKWVEASGLYPVPIRSSSAIEIADWEARFATTVEAWQKFKGAPVVDVGVDRVPTKQDRLGI